MKRFAAVLRNIDKVLDVPQPSRSRVILEISADMQDLYEHLLTMSIGTAWTEEEAEQTHETGDAFFMKLLSKSFAGRPGVKWLYVSANVNLLGGMIKNAAGMHANEFKATHLFDPLGIEKWNWDYGMVDGYRLMDGSLMLTPPSMAKLGALVSGRGSWNGEQVVYTEWIKESTSPQIIPSE